MIDFCLQIYLYLFLIKLIFVLLSFIIQACNCHNHTDTCMYNQTVSDLGLSMNVNRSMIGGGVCIDCQVCFHCNSFFMLNKVLKRLQ